MELPRRSVVGCRRRRCGGLRWRGCDSCRSCRLRRRLRCCQRRGWRHRLIVGVWLWRLDRRKQIVPKDQHWCRSYKGHDESLLLFHSKFLSPTNFSLSDNSLHRIVAARMKRMATKQASHTHQAAAHHAVAFNRFACIFGASRNKSARRRQPRRDYSLIELQERNKYYAHELKLPKFLSLWERLGEGPSTTNTIRNFVPHPGPLPRERELNATLGLSYLGDDVTKLAETRAFA